VQPAAAKSVTPFLPSFPQDSASEWGSEGREFEFKELARQTGLGEKTLHRMLNRNANPAARNLGAITRSIAEDLHVKPRVEMAVCR
jgi:predicted DNA-binding transcriptional regulator AlpA